MIQNIFKKTIQKIFKKKIHKYNQFQNNKKTWMMTLTKKKLMKIQMMKSNKVIKNNLISRLMWKITLCKMMIIRKTFV